jgi:lipopolysaccharide transport system ATP-binding protein
MSDYAIICDGVGKRYRLGQSQKYYALRDTLAELMAASFRRVRQWFGSGSQRPVGADHIWALRDIDLRVRHGEALGIIGRNGAGKTTLLKVLSRVTRPTLGRVIIEGRVGSLLEIGTGFHPELTGRENIYLNGAVLGMRRHEINRRFDEIVDFSGCAAFLDTPVKHYSSGMSTRLAFAVAAHLETEILLVDEVLAVGDAEFQKKCLGKMDEVTHAGRTVLFVSHNMLAVQALCGRAICLDQGRIIDDGKPASVVAQYLKRTMAASTDICYDDPARAPGNDSIRLRRLSVRPEHGSATDVITVRTPVVMKLEYWNYIGDASIDISLEVFNQHGVMVFNTATAGNPPISKGLIRSQVQIPGDFLNSGMYRVALYFVQNQGVSLYHQQDALTFEVLDCVELRGAWYGDWPGAVRPNLAWKTEVLGGLGAPDPAKEKAGDR